MSSANLARISPEKAVRWTARIVSALSVGFIFVMFIGEGGFNPLTLSPVEATQMVLFWTCCAGMLVAWRWELVGGAISLAAVVSFFAVEFAVTGGFPKGLAFQLMLLPGFLFVLSSVLRRWSLPK